MKRSSHIRFLWFYAESGTLKARLALLFVATTVLLILGLSAYWLEGIEPRLQGDAQASATAFAESQTRNLADILARAPAGDQRQSLMAIIDELLVLNDPGTGEPFVHGLSLKVDYDAVKVRAGSLDMSRGNVHCHNCFVTRLPLYSPRNGEVLGVATFYSSNAFFLRLRHDVRMKLLIGSAIALAILMLTWWAINGLFEQVKANEDAARIAARTKSEFLATMSHEIRTPMNGILGMVHLLKRTPLNATQTDYLATIDASGQTLLTLLDDVLDISRIEAGKLRLERRAFDIRNVVEGVIRLLQGQAEEKGLHLEARISSKVPQWLEGDPNRLRQVLLNLMGNAVKFTDTGRVTVEVEAAMSQSHAWLEIAVSDTGPGIAAKQQRELFEPFTQAETGTARRYGGSGLGLAICRRLVEAMDGAIGVRSRVGKGSTFYFRLPLNEADIPATTEVASVATEQVERRPLKILVADDSAINRRVVTELLRQSGHHCVEVADGRQALEAVQREPFDVVLMDLHMPVMDGLDATRAIRQLGEPALASVPVLAVSADIMPEERQACEAAGLDGFIAKPFSPEKLEAELARVAPHRVERPA